MKIASKVKDRFRQSGVRGVVGSALRLAANRLDSTEAQHENVFITFMQFGIPGWLTSENVHAMEYAIKNMPPGKPILEIGSFCGLSTVVLTYLLNKNSKSTLVFTCDKWEFEGQFLGTPLGDSPTVTHDDYRTYLKETFLRTTQTFAANQLPYTIECLSDDFFRRWFDNEEAVDVFGREVTLGGELSFCYIDGNHRYDYSKRDFENTDRALVPGGFILFDDSGDDSHWETNKLTREIASGDRYELISRNPNYLFRKK